MASFFPNGTNLSVSSVFGTASNVTSISNASPAVATLNAGTITTGQFALINSAWAGIDGRATKAASATASAATLTGIDTSDTTRYPTGTGAGAGTLVPVTTWVQLSQVANVAKSGGDQQFYQWQYLEDTTNQQRQRPTYKNAKVITVTLDYDPAKAWYAALAKVDATGTLIILRATLPTGVELLYPVYPSFDADPSFTLNQNMQNVATFSLAGTFTRIEA